MICTMGLINNCLALTVGGSINGQWSTILPPCDNGRGATRGDTGKSLTA